MSKDFFNIEDLLNNSDDKNRKKSKPRPNKSRGSSFTDLSDNNSKKYRKKATPEKRIYPDFDLEKAKNKKNDSYRAKNRNFELHSFSTKESDFSKRSSNNFELNKPNIRGFGQKNTNSMDFDLDKTKNKNNSRSADIYYMDQAVSTNFVSAIEDDNKRFYDPKPRRGRKLYGDDLYSSQELEKTPELVKVTPRTEGRTKTRKTFVNRRSSFLVFSVVVILIFFMALMFLLLNQSRVMQASYENAAIKSQIEKLDKDNAERIERLARDADLNEIAKTASNFGLQIPKRQQIVEVKDDKLDQIIYFNENNNALGIVNNEVDMNLVFDNIESYILEKEKSQEAIEQIDRIE